MMEAPRKGGYFMNDDTFDKEEAESFKRYLIAETAFKKLLKEGLTPMESFGVILGMVANQFKIYGWTRQDFIDFIETMRDTDWPDDPPKKRDHLKLIK